MKTKSTSSTPFFSKYSVENKACFILSLKLQMKNELMSDLFHVEQLTIKIQFSKVLHLESRDWFILGIPKLLVFNWDY